MVAVLLGATALSRWLFRSHLLYDIDSVNFALALGRFDPAAHQPHPPGYFLYICLGRVVNALAHDANTAFVLIGVAAGTAAAGAIYLLAREWFGERAALFSLALFLFSPFCWFHGTVALTYIVEAFFSAWTGYCCWRMRSGGGWWTAAAALSLAASAGFRPSSLVFLLPLWAYSLRRASWRRIAAGCGVLAAGLAAWFVPMTASLGGVSAYLDPLAKLWTTVPGRHTIASGELTMSVARAATIAWIYILCFGAAAPLIAATGSIATPDVSEKRRFTAVWVGPGVLFFTFVFLLYVNGGYLLVLSPPVFVWLAGALDGVYERTMHRRRLLAGVGIACAANTLIFLYAPSYCSYRSVREFEKHMSAVTAAMRSHFDPSTTVIVGFDSHFSGYRHGGYYLPEYLTIQYPELTYPEGARVFLIAHRDTKVVQRIEAGSHDRFVLLPLPPASEYRQYRREVLERFPATVLRTEVIDGTEFVSGSISDLKVLFPRTAATRATGNRGFQAAR
jgi:hypothetical protein